MKKVTYKIAAGVEASSRNFKTKELALAWIAKFSEFGLIVISIK